MMNNQWHDELISAYLDDELTRDEAARVEYLLENDEQCRETYDAFLSVRSAIQNFPQESLTVDLSSSVMSQLGHSPNTNRRRGRNLQIAIWGAFVAAAVVFLIVRFGQDSPTPIDQDDVQTANRDDAQTGDNPQNNQDIVVDSPRQDDPKNPSDNDVQSTNGGGGLVKNNPDSGNTVTSDDDDPNNLRTVVNDPPKNPLVNDPRDPRVNDPVTPHSIGVDLTVVYDVVVKGSPRDDQWFRKMLRESGINLRDGVVTVDDDVATKIQKGLIAGAVPGDIAPVDPMDSGSDDEGPALRLVYVRSTGAKLEALYGRLQSSTDEVKVVVPGIALGVEQLLLRSAKLGDATGVVIGMGSKVTEQFVSSMGGAPKPVVQDRPTMLSGTGQDTLFGLLIVLRNPASLK
jgi:hypothetical protein